MNIDQFVRRLHQTHGVEIEFKGDQHPLVVRRGDRKSLIPTHGGREQFGKGLETKIMRDLGIEGRVPEWLVFDRKIKPEVIHPLPVRR